MLFVALLIVLAVVYRQRLAQWSRQAGHTVGQVITAFQEGLREGRTPPR